MTTSTTHRPHYHPSLSLNLLDVATHLPVVYFSSESALYCCGSSFCWHHPETGRYIAGNIMTSISPSGTARRSQIQYSALLPRLLLSVMPTSTIPDIAQAKAWTCRTSSQPRAFARVPDKSREKPTHLGLGACPRSLRRFSNSHDIVFDEGGGDRAPSRVKTLRSSNLTTRTQGAAKTTSQHHRTTTGEAPYRHCNRRREHQSNTEAIKNALIFLPPTLTPNERPARRRRPVNILPKQ